MRVVVDVEAVLGLVAAQFDAETINGGSVELLFTIERQTLDTCKACCVETVSGVARGAG